MAKGYIKLHRQMTEHYLYNEKPFDRAHAWIDLLFLASWKDATRDFKGQILEQKRGEVITSVKALSERWGWSEGKVKRFLNSLEMDEMCRQKRLSHGRVITIEKFAFFQDARQSNGPSHGPSRGLSRDDNRRKDKESIKKAWLREDGSVDVSSLPREEVEELERLTGRKFD